MKIVTFFMRIRNTIPIPGGPVLPTTANAGTVQHQWTLVEQTNETEFLVLPALNLPTEDDVDLLFQCKSCPVDFYQQVCYSLWVTCCGCKTFCWLKCSWKLSTSVFTSNFDSKHIYHCVCGPTTCRQLQCVCMCEW